MLVTEKIKTKSFTQLDTWGKAHQFVLSTYKITQKFPQAELFALSSQMNRCAISITSNIAEGFSRQSKKRKDTILLYGAGINH